MSDPDNIQLDTVPNNKESSNNHNNNHVDEKKSKEEAATPLKVAQQKPKKEGYKERFRRACKTKPHLFLIFIVSVIGFCYHFNLTMIQYMDYKTTVSLTNEEPKDYKFSYPSVTMCFLDVIPYYKLAPMFPDYVEKVANVNNEMARRNDSNFWNSDKAQSFINIPHARNGKEMHKYYEDRIFRNETILSVLENYSYKYHDECLLDTTPATTYGYKLNKCENISEPVESVNGQFRCLSYFLQLDRKNGSDSDNEFDENFMTSVFVTSKTFEQRKNRVYYMSYANDPKRVPHPFETAMRSRFAIHPPNMIPVPEFYPTIPLYEYSRFYAIDFKKTVLYLLEKPYQTNCFKYDLGNREAIQSKDDCVTKCIMDKYRKKCKCLPRFGLLYRKAVLSPEDRFCSIKNKCQYTNYRSQCDNKCQSDCVEEMYEFEKYTDIPFYAHNNLTGIQVMRNSALDKVYRHSPAMTFIQLICDFGGLGGLWLGFSVITITTSIIQLIAKPLEKIVVVKDDDEEKKRQPKDE